MNTRNNQAELQPRFVDPPTAAQLLSLSTVTVLRMCRDGRIDGRKFGKKWRIPMTAIDQLEHRDIPMNNTD